MTTNSTTTYDPSDPRYADEAEVRSEMTRVFDVCNGCRRCVNFCTSFPSLFEMIERHADPEAGSLTPAEQDRVVNECFQCKLCALSCPYVPERSELAVDVPSLLLRAKAMQFQSDHTTMRSTATTRLLGRSDAVGRIATSVPTVANRIVGARPGSWTRRIAAALTGITSSRLLPRYAKQRFSEWFANRPIIHIRKHQAEVTVFPTCLVEYQATGIGKDLVKVYERNGIECADSAAGCCGAPLLHGGNLARFRKVATENVVRLAAEVRRGTDIVVAQPTCSHVIRRDYPAYVPASVRADAELVSEHTSDAVEYLMSLHRGDDYVLDTDFTGRIPRSITYVSPSHLRAQKLGFTSRDLMRLTGANIRVVQQSSGAEGLWSLDADHDEVSLTMARRLAEQVEGVGSEVVVGDCHLTNLAIEEQTGQRPMHPLQLVARAYGIPEEH